MITFKTANVFQYEGTLKERTFAVPQSAALERLLNAMAKSVLSEDPALSAYTGLTLEEMEPALFRAVQKQFPALELIDHKILQAAGARKPGRIY